MTTWFKPFLEKQCTWLFISQLKPNINKRCNNRSSAVDHGFYKKDWCNVHYLLEIIFHYLHVYCCVCVKNCRWQVDGAPLITNSKLQLTLGYLTTRIFSRRWALAVSSRDQWRSLKHGARLHQEEEKVSFLPLFMTVVKNILNVTISIVPFNSHGCSETFIDASLCVKWSYKGHHKPFDRYCQPYRDA